MEIQPPDRPLRTVALLVFIGLVAAGAAGLVMFQDWLDGVRHLAPAEARRALRAAFAWISGTMIASSLLIGLFLWRLGARIQRAAQFPLPGMRVIRVTPVLRGDVARRRGKVLQGLGGVLVLCALGLLAACWYLYSRVFVSAA